MADFHRANFMDLATFIDSKKEELRPVLSPVVPIVFVEESSALCVARNPYFPLKYSEENGGAPSVGCVLSVTLALCKGRSYGTHRGLPMAHARDLNYASLNVLSTGHRA